MPARSTRRRCAQRLACVSLPDYAPLKGRDNQRGFNPEEQLTKTYLGMGEEDINLHDLWAVESLGAIQDRTREHLGTSDKVIIANRRTLLKAIETVRAGGRPPMALASDTDAAALTGPDTIDCIAPAGSWEVYWASAAAAKRHGADWLCAATRESVLAGSQREALAVTTFAEAYGASGASRAAASESPARRMKDEGIDLVRVGWCDPHGVLRGKTLTAAAVPRALENCVGMASTILLKDTSDRTAYQVFEPGALASLPGFGFANNLLLLPDPASFRLLSWAPNTGWLRAEAWFDDAMPVTIDTRFILRRALERLAAAGFGLKCGLEVEFHIYRLASASGGDDASLDPQRAAWPGEPPAVAMIHPGYNLLSEAWANRADEALRIVQRTAQGLGLPLASLEIELGPSQVEAVFDATDALTAADHMVSFRGGVTQALRRAGYHASFACRPPFANVMASGWHLHQSLVELKTGANAFLRAAPAPGTGCDDARHVLSAHGESWLAGLLAHGAGRTLFCAPTVNAYARFRPNAMAPNAVIWGRDNRGAMLRVLGSAGEAATRIENRIGEPAANPYLYIASQIHAGLDGIARGLGAPPATGAPYAKSGARLPVSLGAALDALSADDRLVAASVHRWSTGSRASSARSWRATTRPTTRTTGRRASISVASEVRRPARPARLFTSWSGQ